MASTSVPATVHPATWFADAARRATARGDHALAAAINALPAAAVNDPVTYAALTEPVAAAVAAAEPKHKS